ncbi:calphotin-like [Wyeomyia smithii]|uniref:calphotin-like n=1 Tax=Wyeomyia smithii TaxID=174621 RepID=UPI002467C5C3|nr:calphotin-like [Wyeomyia smithii]
MVVKVLLVICLLAVVSAKPHVCAHISPAFVTAHSSQVFARTYNGIVPIAVPAHIPAPIPAAFPAPVPTIYVPPPTGPAFFAYPVYAPGPAAIPAVPAVVATPTVVATAPVAKVVSAAPAAKLVRRPAIYLTTIRHRSVYV